MSTASDLTFKLNDGNSIPWIAFGTGTALSRQDVTNSIKGAVECGIVHLDGAQMYRNEETLGTGIKASPKPRSELFVNTKLHELAPGETVVESLQKSLAKLQLDYVDLFLIHDPTKHPLKEVWKGMEECKQKGLAKSIGVSNFSINFIEEILEHATIVPAVNQIEIHPYVYRTAKPVIDYCKSKGIVVESYGGQTPIFRQTGGPLDPVLEKIRARLEATRGSPVSAGQVLSRFYRQQEIVIVMTTRNEDRLKEFLDTANVPDLTAEEIKEIEEAGLQVFNRVFMKQCFTEVDAKVVDTPAA